MNQFDEVPEPCSADAELLATNAELRKEIAERKRIEADLRESEQRFRLLVENVRDYAIVMLDLGGRVASWNGGAERILGYRAKDIIGRDFACFYPREEIERSSPSMELKVAAATNRFEVDAQRLRQDGTRFWANVIITALRDEANRLRGFALVIRDITERKHAEEAMLARSQELARANRELLHKNQENEMFVYSVSHDLRSPLVNLQGFSKELSLVTHTLSGLLEDPEVPASVRQRVRGLIDGEMAESLRFIMTAVNRLSSIIDALLRLSRAGRVVYQRQEVNVQAMVQRVVDALHTTISQRQATVILPDSLPSVWGDATALEQIFANLIGNALHYLDPHRPGKVEIGCLPDADRMRTYFVRDNGLGIAEAHMPKVFQAFQRLHPGTADGEGIGLTIVQRIVQRHHGKIWVESVAGKGSTFYVSLPLAA